MILFETVFGVTMALALPILIVRVMDYSLRFVLENYCKPRDKRNTDVCGGSIGFEQDGSDGDEDGNLHRPH